MNTEGRDPATLERAQRDAITEALEKYFGTPDEPRTPSETGLDLALLRRAAGPADAEGQGLFRRHCVRCHGISGDGAGGEAAALDPYPRDYRRGVFKYTSTFAGAKPVREDLRRTIFRGVPGTAMPSFDDLADNEIDALVEYVRYLAIRGEVELYLFQLVVDEDEYLPLDMRYVEEEGLVPVAELWKMAEEMVVVPPPEPPVDTLERLAASIARGAELYASKNAQCVQCHGPEGNGEGEEDELYDDWNKPKKGVTPERTKELAALYRLPLQELNPRNFREGIFQGGDRPIDLYWRIHVGIKGTPMPAAGPIPGAAGVYTPEEVWDVVHYIQSFSAKKP